MLNIFLFLEHIYNIIMSSYYNKNNSLVKYGIKGELIGKFYIEHFKNELFINFNSDDKFDLLSNKYKYEIKTDSNYIKYNSIFLEFESNEKESGIKTSKSNKYIFICPNNNNFEIVKIFEIETNFLKELIINNKFIIKISPCKDYYNNSYNINKGYIFYKKQIF